MPEFIQPEIKTVGLGEKIEFNHSLKNSELKEKFIKMYEQDPDSAWLGLVTTIMSTDSSEEILKHYGIEGQKWGVRNGPPYPLDRQKVKKSSIQDKAKRVLKDADDLTLDELRLLAQKIEWEKKLSDIAFEKKNTSNTFAKEILKSVGQTVVSVAVPIATKYIIKQVFEKAIGDNVEVIVPGMPTKKS